LSVDGQKKRKKGAIVAESVGMGMEIPPRWFIGLEVCSMIRIQCIECEAFFGGVWGDSYCPSCWSILKERRE
jgi:hypothetical protein